jgi:hypothetical protein
LHEIWQTAITGVIMAMSNFILASLDHLITFWDFAKKARTV